MNPSPYPFHDFLRAKQHLLSALAEHPEPFVLLTGETGTGKTALLRQIRSELDRTRYRVLYFAQARKLGAAGLIKVVGECLRVRTSMCHSLSFERLLRALGDEQHTLLLWLDEAHDLPEETLAEARALARKRPRWQAPRPDPARRSAQTARRNSRPKPTCGAASSCARKSPV